MRFRARPAGVPGRQGRLGGRKSGKQGGRGCRGGLKKAETEGKARVLILSPHTKRWADRESGKGGSPSSNAP